MLKVKKAALVDSGLKASTLTGKTPTLGELPKKSRVGTTKVNQCGIEPLGFSLIIQERPLPDSSTMTLSYS